MSTVSTERPDDADAPAGAPVIELRGITKRFPGVVANYDVNLTVGRGEVHAVVGENGAGKSTLMKTLYGMHQPDEGTILLDGRHVQFKTPTDGHRRRHRHGAPALHARRQLHRPGEHHPRRRAGAGGRDRLRGRARQGAARSPTATASACAPTRLVEDLCVGRPPAGGDPQGALPRRPRSSSSTSRPPCSSPRRSTSSSPTSTRLRAEGLTVIFISHKLDEVLRSPTRSPSSGAARPSARPTPRR